MENNTQHEVPVFQLGKPGFFIIHIPAVTACFLSVIFSSSVLLVFTISGCRTSRSFWQLTIGERLVFYLVVCDLGFSISHGTDHAFMLGYKRHPPEPFCTIFAFLLQTFMCAQSLVVNVAAIVAVIMLVQERKIGFGKYDWALIVYAFGIPCAVGIFAISVDFLGPSGPWCLADVNKTGGKILNVVYSAVFIAVFFTNTVSYILAIIKLRRVSKAICKLSDKAFKASMERTNRSTKSMLVFVVIYIIQWWPFMVYSIWTFIVPAPLWVISFTVSLSNFGGVFNTIAYTIIKKWNALAKKKAHKLESNTSNNSQAESSLNEDFSKTETLSTCREVY